MFKLCSLAYKSRNYISSFQELRQGLVHTHQTPQQLKVPTSLTSTYCHVKFSHGFRHLISLASYQVGIVSTGQTYFQKYLQLGLVGIVCCLPDKTTVHG